MPNSILDHWADLLSRLGPTLIGGDIEQVSTQHIMRGPITSIVIREGDLIVTTEWTALRPRYGGA